MQTPGPNRLTACFPFHCSSLNSDAVFSAHPIPLPQAMKPTQWLNSFGHAINTALNGDRGVPLPLTGEPGRHWRLRFVNIGETAPPATPHLQSSALVWPCDRPTLPLPAGLGALIARREALGCLQRRYFGGGTVAVSLADEPFHRCAPSLPLF